VVPLKHIYGVHKEVIPAISVRISALQVCMLIFAWNFTQLLNNKEHYVLLKYIQKWQNYATSEYAYSIAFFFLLSTKADYFFHLLYPEPRHSWRDFVHPADNLMIY